MKERTGVWATEVEPTWCPGCGNFGILKALRQALAELRLKPWQVCVVAGIGQAGRTAHYLGANYLHGLHGRALAHALGTRLANHRLKVIVIGGDGDIYAEGGNHLMHSFRRNPQITLFVHNNGVYGLTRGQPGPTSTPDLARRSTGQLMPPFNPVLFALGLGASFVCRGFAGDQAQLVRLMVETLSHQGFGFLDILQPCVTYQRPNPYAWYGERVYDLATEGHDPSDLSQALKRAREWPDPSGADHRIPVGVFVRRRRPVYEEQLPSLARGPLIDRKPDTRKLAAALEEFD
jgi:2-oxoglutarate ferredoxin oxidoreductase subunit beta